MAGEKKQHEGAVDARHRAAALFAEGMSRAAVARAVGKCRATMTEWYRAWEEHGEEALTSAKTPGRKPLLVTSDLEAVQRALMDSPRASGFELDQWSLASIALLIERHTGVKHHPRHVVRVLTRMGWVIPPVGAPAGDAFCRIELHDPDGNVVYLQQRRDGSARVGE